MAELSYFSCGGPRCPKGGEHVWDGPEIEFKQKCPKCEGLPRPSPECRTCGGTGEWVCGGSVTCSKCGLDAMSHDLLNAP